MQFTFFHRNWLSEAKNLCSIKDTKEFGLDTLEEEIGMLEKELSRDYHEIGFCHNDLQYGNIMMDEETRSITLIVSFLLCSVLIICFCGFESNYTFTFFISFFMFLAGFKISLYRYHIIRETARL